MNAYIRFVKRNRQDRNWTLSELARRAGLSHPEISRMETGARMPTIRHVRGLSEAFSGAPTSRAGEPTSYESWLAILVDLAERARQNHRTSKRELKPPQPDSSPASEAPLPESGDAYT